MLVETHVKVNMLVVKMKCHHSNGNVRNRRDGATAGSGAIVKCSENGHLRTKTKEGPQSLRSIEVVCQSLVATNRGQRKSLEQHRHFEATYYFYKLIFLLYLFLSKVMFSFIKLIWRFANVKFICYLRLSTLIM